MMNFIWVNNKKIIKNKGGGRHKLTRQNGLRFISQMRFLRTVGLATLFFPLADGLVAHSIELFWWVLLVMWVFLWPQLAWNIACRAAAPRHSELNNVKADGVVAGFWIGILEMNPLIALAVLVVVGLNFLGAGGMKIFISGMLLLLISVLITSELFAVSMSFMSTHTNFFWVIPAVMLYPFVFSCVSYYTVLELIRDKQKLKETSSRDGMTGIYNRTHWDRLVYDEFETCRQSGVQAIVMLIDIDHFKKINDTWGHDAGDEAIMTFSKALQSSLRKDDICGRLGGDEFAVFMRDVSPLNALAVMSRIRRSLKDVPLAGAARVQLGISVGVAILTPGTDNCQAWIKKADMALYHAKEAGRNRTKIAV